MVSGRDGKNFEGTGIKIGSSQAYLRLKLRFDNRVTLNEKAPHKQHIFWSNFLCRASEGGIYIPPES